MQKRKDVNQVFTPRGKDVNEKMYISRPILERELIRSVTGTKHSLLFGESGNGKTWLYKHVFNKHKIPYVVANSGNVSRHDSIAKTICNSINGNTTQRKDGYIDKTNAGISAVFANGGTSHENKYSITVNDPLLDALQKYDKKSKAGTPCIIVIDNLELICSEDHLMKELESLIILLDDETYGFDNLKFLLVGLPQNILTYFRRQKNIESISNRLEEVTQVRGLSYENIRHLTEQGFIHQLKVPNIGKMESDAIASRVHKITLGTAQHVHEYCRYLAICIEDNRWHFELGLYPKADDKFLRSSLRKAYLIIDEHLNKINTKVARKNQVIFAIGKITGHEFTSSQIEEILKKEFPDSICNNMGISSILTKLASHEKKMLTRNKKTNTYAILDPAVLMCIRIVLHKENGKVIKYLFKNFS